MGFKPLKPEYTAWARRRRLLRWAGALMLVALGAVVALDHLGYFGFRGDDWRTFDGRPVRVSRAIDGRSFVTFVEGREVTVALAGIQASGGTAVARQYLAEQLNG